MSVLCGHTVGAMWGLGRRAFGRRSRQWSGLAAVSLVVLAAAATAPGPLRAENLRLELPVACDMAKVCSIQKYVDHDPGPGRVDYACGRLSLDGDHGTDFRVPDYVTMEQGVAVVAAAPGVVKSTRDDMADVSVRQIGQEALGGRFAGNGVVIDHGNGWETQYSHLKRGSIAVKPGQRVATGERLGLIGLSGNTEFPHVEFTLRHRGKPVDPFVGPVPFSDCREARAPLWSAAALASLPYRPTGSLIAGFAGERPEAEAARRGRFADRRLPGDVPALVMWADLYGAMQGDRQSFRIEGPDGSVVHRAETELKESNVSWFAFSGRRRPDGGWPPGRYTGTYTLSRDGVDVVTMTATVDIDTVR
jgi:murein DD-endopeptidase MepM/ murein hydrolase activator NlpD